MSANDLNRAPTKDELIAQLADKVRELRQESANLAGTVAFLRSERDELQRRVTELEDELEYERQNPVG